MKRFPNLSFYFIPTPLHSPLWASHSSLLGTLWSSRFNSISRHSYLPISLDEGKNTLVTI